MSLEIAPRKKSLQTRRSKEIITPLPAAASHSDRRQPFSSRLSRDTTETPEEIEEERRLLYVAMTRAKDELDLIVPERSYIRNQFKTDDRYIYGSRSRFIPDSVRRLFECHRWHDGKSDSDRVQSKTFLSRSPPLKNPFGTIAVWEASIAA